MHILAPLYSAFAPFVLWPIEYLLPVPHIIEELAKFFIVKISKIEDRKKAFQMFFLSGILFAFTETVLYSLNIFSLGDPKVFLTRFLYTSALHSTTFLIIAYFYYSNKKFRTLGLLITMFVHYYYNLWVGNAI